ncbi:hypothetical protein BDM02DRAFT_1524747 [Thelephora ganbajun]|uniref:Uncharacterized protein n=1 Tax=Thelephora ganbajun TaxID=370292 RepID=A0ACB6Z0R0_THEGA|nr:hypothetical protein BDM02DRAFT_1524747 [Thelephora ganbajun]
MHLHHLRCVYRGDPRENSAILETFPGSHQRDVRSDVTESPVEWKDGSSEKGNFVISVLYNLRKSNKHVMTLALHRYHRHSQWRSALASSTVPASTSTLSAQRSITSCFPVVR